MLSFSDIYQGFFVPASIAVPVTVAIRRYRFAGKGPRGILWYLLVSGFINGIAIILSFLRTNNLPLLHVYTVIELVLLGQFFSYSFRSAFMRNWIRGIQLVFVLLCTVNFCFIQSLYIFNSYTRPLEAIVIICLSLLYLYSLTGPDAAVPWTTLPEVWIAAGLLIYFSTSFSEFTFANVVSVKASRSVKLLIWNIHDTMVLIMYLFFAKGFTQCKS